MRHRVRKPLQILVGAAQSFFRLARAQEGFDGGDQNLRLYRPNYIRAAELQKLITPLLTPQIGSITVTSPAGKGTVTITVVTDQLARAFTLQA